MLDFIDSDRRPYSSPNAKDSKYESMFETDLNTAIRYYKEQASNYDCILDMEKVKSEIQRLMEVRLDELLEKEDESV